MKKKTIYSTPGSELLEAELRRVRHNQRYRVLLRSTVYTLVTVAAISVLVATLWLPVLQIFGSSMTPTLHNGEIVFSMKTADFEQGDIVAFYYNNKILVKRMIAGPGDWVDMDPDGTVFVNSKEIHEPYITDLAYGETNITFPYQVPDGKIFVLGDHRATSLDSRNTAVGCIAQEQVIGKIVFRIWPIDKIGVV